MPVLQWVAQDSLLDVAWFEQMNSSRPTYRYRGWFSPTIIVLGLTLVGIVLSVGGQGGFWRALRGWQESLHQQAQHQAHAAAQLATEFLRIGEYKSFPAGVHAYEINTPAAQQLPGRFELSVTDTAVRLTWQPAARG